MRQANSRVVQRAEKANKNEKQILFSEEAPLKTKDSLQQKLFVVALVIVVALSFQFSKFSHASLHIFLSYAPTKTNWQNKNKKILKKSKYYSNSASYFPIFFYATDSALRRVRLQLQLL